LRSCAAAGLRSADSLGCRAPGYPAADVACRYSGRQPGRCSVVASTTVRKWAPRLLTALTAIHRVARRRSAAFALLPFVHSAEFQNAEGSMCGHCCRPRGSSQRPLPAHSGRPPMVKDAAVRLAIAAIRCDRENRWQTNSPIAGRTDHWPSAIQCTLNLTPSRGHTLSSPWFKQRLHDRAIWHIALAALCRHADKGLFQLPQPFDLFTHRS